MTQLELVNKILRRLREDTVTTVAETSYSQLIAQFINDAKADMEDLNWNWSAYETEIDLAILGDSTTVEYAVTGTNDRSWLIRDKDEDRLPLAYDVTTDEQRQLCDMALKALRKSVALRTPGTSQTAPGTFAIAADNGLDAGYKVILLYPAEEARTWRMYWYVPQADMEIDGTTDNTQILLPPRPIEMGAMYYALNERGDNLGQDPTIGAARYKNTIAAALETDMQVQKKSDEADIRNDENL